MENRLNARIDRLEKSIDARMDTIEKTMCDAEKKLDHKTDTVENRLRKLINSTDSLIQPLVRLRHHSFSQGRKF